MERYILDHLDEAIARGYIHVYVQPVVRTLTRQVCGMEALARWQDPVHGLLMPGIFISVLEKHRRIHELDLYVVQKVCEHYRYSGNRVDVPVSVNLSRLDYELCDIFLAVEAEVRANKVPRSHLCIEITESALSENEDLMRDYIDRFREAGYAVWMDDFGSGYSSLNVLKDFELDELKIDMRFLSDFHDRSKMILASIIQMAKHINIQTLAEGVETEEQFAFLRNIGCEKVQGYLFGRPMPFEECLEHVADSGMTWEPPNLRGYYDKTGSLNVLSATPFPAPGANVGQINGRELNSISLAILELKGDEAEMLFSNQAFEDTAFSTDWPLAWTGPTGMSILPLDRISQRLQKLLEETRTEGKGRILSVYNDDYYEMRTLRLARYGSSCTILVSITNLSQVAQVDSQQSLDEGLRSLYSAYEQVLLINLDNLTVISLHRDRDAGLRLPAGNLRDRTEEYSRHRLFPDDRERFKSFMCPDTLEERVSQSGNISIQLRTLSFHGVYVWKSYWLIRIRKNSYYLLIRDVEKEIREIRAVAMAAETSNNVLTPKLLWENVVNNSDLKFFWKDKQRRFAGVSRSFLDHYDLHSQADVIGKTDEDMGWHIHQDPYMSEEWKVLKEGITSRQVDGNCLVQGETKKIVATKRPLYSRDGKIVGLIGSFYETEAETSEKAATKKARTDELTGLLNNRALHEDLYAYVDEYQLRQKDFARIEVAIDDFTDISSRYGYSFGDEVIRQTGAALRRCCGNTATVGRFSGYYFTILRQYEDPAELTDLIASIRQIPNMLHEIDGVPFNMYLSVGMALYSETENRENMAAQAILRRMTDDVEGISQRQLIENTGHIFQIFDELPISYGVYKVIHEQGDDDAVQLYANHKFMQMTRTNPEKLIGKRVSRFFPVCSNEWYSLAKQAGLEGKTVTGQFHFSILNCDIEATAYPIIGRGFCAFTFQTIDN
ncbi:MAG: EAL domain-containing protein [Eubacterium sp.]|nr:EAL domain-containing protein [Eubacterium sp.]